MRGTQFFFTLPRNLLMKARIESAHSLDVMSWSVPLTFLPAVYA